MFTGIVECTGIIKKIRKNGSNKIFTIKAPFVDELKINQSISHNGVCLTVSNINLPYYEVIAIDETLQKSNLKYLQEGDIINLERSLKLNERLDGHLVQGHIDQTATCYNIENIDGSWKFYFKFDEKAKFNLVSKGSISVNGVSLTIVDVLSNDAFSVCIIPYTFENTNFSKLQNGSKVNIEFDIIGKYIENIIAKRFPKQFF